MPEFIWQWPEWPKNLRWEPGPVLAPLAHVERTQGLVLGALRTVGVDVEEESLVDEAMTTSAIEGEALNRDSVRSSVALRLGLKTAGRPAERDRAIDGLVEVLSDATRNHDQPLVSERLWGWHAALFPTGRSGLKRISVGAWREGPEAMQVVSGIAGDVVHFEAPPSSIVPKEMDNFFAWWSETLGDTNGLVRAALAHLYFVTIHPFDDGNGRIARAISDMALAQHDGYEKRYFSMSREIERNRRSYYDALEAAQRGDGDVTPWVVWFLNTLAQALERTLDVVKQVQVRTQFWDTLQESELNARQHKVVSRLLEAGPGGFVGGLTNRKYMAIAKTSKPTATRDLSDLVSKGVLRIGAAGGRSTFYELVWPRSEGR